MVILHHILINNILLSMKNRFNFKSIFIAIILIGFTTTAGLAAIWSGLNLFNWDLTVQEQQELDNEKLSLNEYIYIYSGETKLISFPRKVETIEFSKDSGFSIRTLVGGIWKDMSNNPHDYEVMQWYIVRNFWEERVNIHVTYSPINSADQTLYQKELKAGWNLYAPAVKNDYCTAVKTSDALIGSNYSQIIDFSTMWFKKYFSNEVSIDHIYSGETLFFNKYNGNPQDFREDWNYSIKNSGDTEEDFIYEWSAYWVFVNNDTLVSWNQNITDDSGNEMIRYNSHPLVVFNDNLSTELDIIDNNKVELLNFDLTSKYAGEDVKGTSSILASLSISAFDSTWSKLTDVFDNLTLKVDGLNTPFTITQCRIDDKIEKCNNGNIYLHLIEPKLLTRGLVTNFVLEANTKNNIKTIYDIRLDLSNTLILDDQNLLPYCKYEGYILGDKSYSGRDINIDTTWKWWGWSDINPSELDAASKLVDQWIIEGHGWDDTWYELWKTILRQDMSDIFRKVAGLELKNTCDNRFTDISSTRPNEWVCSSVEALFDNGFLHANAEFRPLDQILKIEALELALKTTGTSYVFNTGSAVSNNEQIVNFAVEQGITNHFTDYQKLITKWEVYVFIVSAQDSINKGDDILTELDCLLWGNCDNWTGSIHSGSTILAPTNVRLGTTWTVTQWVFWDTVEWAESYRIDYFMSGWLVENNTSDSGYVTLHHLNDDTNYTVQVFAIWSGTMSTWSELVHFKTLVSEALEWPKNITLDRAYADKLQLSWNAVNTASGYRILYSSANDIVPTGVDTNTNSILLEYLSEATEYDISIQTINSKGNTGWSSSNIKFSTLENINNWTWWTNTGTTLESPVNIRELNSWTWSMKITWDSIETALGYHLYYSTNPNIDISTANKLEYIPEIFVDINNLIQDTQYYFAVQAFNTDWILSELSEEIMFKTKQEQSSLVLIPSIIKPLTISWAELKIFVDVWTNSWELVELTSLNFTSPGATEWKKYRIINVDLSTGWVTASVSNNNINFNISWNMDFNITTDGTYIITPENMNTDETAALELQSIDYKIWAESFTKSLERPLDFGSFTY